MRRDSAASVVEATVKVRVGKEFAHTVADGDGPVNALDAALRAALVRFYRQLEQVRLTDYKVRIIDSGSGTAAKTRVLIQIERRHRPSGERSAWTRTSSKPACRRSSTASSTRW